MPRCFLPRFLALSDIDDDEAFDDGASEDVSDDGISESDDDDEALRDSRARILRRDFRFFFCSGRCLTHCSNHCLNHLFSKVYMQFRNSSCTRL